MIKEIIYRDELISGYFINSDTAEITDIDGNVQSKVLYADGRMYWKRKAVYKLMMHTFVGPQGKNIDIHHIDKNKLNDVLSNLMYVPHKDHPKYHAEERAGENNGMYNHEWTEEELAVLSEVQTGKVWWSKEGEKPVKSKECPGEGWVRGRKMSEEDYNAWIKNLKKAMQIRIANTTEEERQKHSEMYKGEKNPAFGRKWWTNGIDQQYCTNQPGPNYVNMTLKKYLKLKQLIHK